MAVEEFKLMKDLKHPNIVQLLGVCTRKVPFLIITELTSNGSLLDYLRGPSGKALSLKNLVYIAQQVCSAMVYLESRNVLHR